MTTPEENKALVRRFYEEIDKGNPSTSISPNLSSRAFIF